jgi:hypothetical protein
VLLECKEGTSLQTRSLYQGRRGRTGATLGTILLGTFGFKNRVQLVAQIPTDYTYLDKSFRMIKFQIDQECVRFAVKDRMET